MSEHCTREWYSTYVLPEQTALAGRIRQEISCVPVDNAQYRQVMEKRAVEEEKRMKREILFEPGLVAATSGGTMAIGPGLAFDSFIVRATSIFILKRAKKMAQKTKSKKTEKSQKMKAARIPQNELLDLIYDCFKQYEYWSMKSLIGRLRQPAAYLKETLEMVGHLVRSGRFANHWQLKPDAKTGAYEAYAQAKDEQAPDEGLDDVSELDGDEDPDVDEMVDVIPS